MKALGIGAIAVPAVVAGTVDDPVTKAKEDGLLSVDPIGDVRHKSDPHFFSRPEIDSIVADSNNPILVRSKPPGRFYDTGAERPKFIAPPSLPYAVNVQGRDLPVKNIKLDLNDQTFRIQHLCVDELDVSSKTFTLRIREEGTEYLLDTMFTARPLVGRHSWHFGLIDAAGFTAMCHTDRYATPASRGWNESLEYWGGRPYWDVFTDKGLTFHIRGPATIKGIFVAGGPHAINKLDHSPGGVLWAMALFDQGDISVVHGDTLIVEGV